MASGISTAIHNDILDHLLLTAEWEQPAGIYVALFNGDPHGAGTELSGNSYARVQHEAWNAAASGEATNDGVVTFPTASGNWSQATYFALYSASSGGVFLAGGPLAVAKTVQNGDTASFDDEEITVALEQTA